MTPMLPHDENAERQVLACCMQYDTPMDEVAGILSPDDFYVHSKRHPEIYAAMKRLYDKGEMINAVAIEHEMGLHDDEVFNYLIHLSECVSLQDDAAQAARIVSNEAKRRQIMQACQRGMNDAHEQQDADAVLERLDQALAQIGAPAHEQDFQTLAQVSYDYLERFSTLSKHRGEISGVPSGFHLLDFMLGGFQPQNMIVVAGRPGTGKTSLALSMVYNAAFHHNKKVAVFSLEMSKMELFGRLVSMRACIDGRRLRTPWQLTSEEQERAQYAIVELEHHQIVIDDTQALSTTELRSKARRLKAKYGLDLIVIDYMQLMRALTDDGKRIRERHLEVAEISMAIKGLAKELDVPILALAQLNREVESRSSKIPQLSDLRESGQIEQDSDVVMFIYCEELYNPQTDRKGQTDLIIAKQRNGPVGEVTLGFKPEYTLFTNLMVEGELTR
jgi:replicative DNA helicase